jgi:hypothetical protein
MPNLHRARRARGPRAPLLAGSVLAAGAVAAGLAPMPALAAGPDQPDPARVAALVQDWPKASREAAQEMVGRYGPPQEATPTLLIWQGNSPWKRTVVRKTPVEHDFPVAHADVVEQVVEYRVPLNFFTPLATFDGSVVADRTRGELASSGDREATNVLSLNLADDIVRGRKTVEQARDAMAAAARDMAAGRMPDDARELHLPPPQGDLADPDTAVVAPPGR